MKPQNENAVIVPVLFAILIISLILNFMQGRQVTECMDRVEELEYYNAILSSQVSNMDSDSAIGED